MNFLFRTFRLGQVAKNTINEAKCEAMNNVEIQALLQIITEWSSFSSSSFNVIQP